MKEIYAANEISEMIYELGEEVLKDLKERFEGIDRTAEINSLKVLKAMRDNKVAEAHFNPTTGYGYNDIGREALESVYASIFHTESALVRPQLMCGTHALCVALF